MAKVYKRICIKNQAVKIENRYRVWILRGKEYATSHVRPDKTVLVYCCSTPFPAVPVTYFAGAEAL